MRQRRWLPRWTPPARRPPTLRRTVLRHLTGRPRGPACRHVHDALPPWATTGPTTGMAACSTPQTGVRPSPKPSSPTTTWSRDTKPHASGAAAATPLHTRQAVQHRPRTRHTERRRLDSRLCWRARSSTRRAAPADTPPTRRRDHRVLGADSSPDMLRLAPRCRRLGSCAAICTGCPSPSVPWTSSCAGRRWSTCRRSPVMAGFARVLRLGGHLAVSDVHRDLVRCWLPEIRPLQDGGCWRGLKPPSPRLGVCASRPTLRRTMRT